MENNITVNTSLNLLHDIIIPPAISNWPLAPGWYALALLVFAYGFHVGIRYWDRYQTNLYRREALQILDKVKLEENSTLQINSLLSIMKRVGIQHFGRKDVASLSHNEWWDFVEKYSKVNAGTDIRELSQKVLYSPNVKITHNDVEAFSKVAKVWIDTHEGDNNA